MPAAERALCHICWHPYAGIAHEGAGEPDSAIAAYTAYLETPYAARIAGHSGRSPVRQLRNPPRALESVAPT